MITFIYIAMLTICLIYSLINKKSKIVSLFVSIGTFLLFAGNTSNSDSNLYLYSFLTGDYDRYEIGYKVLYDLFRKIGVSDYQITVVIIFVILTLISYFCVRKFTNNYLPFLLFLLISELFIETVQLRTFIASILLFAAITYYPENKVKSLIFCVLSASFQMVGLFYLPFFIYSMFKKDNIFENSKIKYQYVGVFLSIFALFLILNNFLDLNVILFIVEAIATKIPAFEHMTFYLGGTNWGSIPFVLLYLSNILTLWFINRNTNDSFLKYKSLILNINVYAALCLPLLFVDMNFYRIFRILNIANFAYYSSVLWCSHKRLSVNYLKKFGFICVVQLIWTVNYVVRVPEIFTDILSNNMWLG